MCVRACVRACECVRACARARACVCICVCVCVRVCVIIFLSARMGDTLPVWIIICYYARTVGRAKQDSEAASRSMYWDDGFILLLTCSCSLPSGTY